MINNNRMCWSKEVSITTYIIGLLGCFMLYNKGHPIEALFYGWVVHMQLIEYFLWKYQPCVGPAKSKNEEVTKIGTIVNHFEPIILWWAILKYGTKLPDWMQTWMSGFVVATIAYTKRVLDTSECTTVTKESDPHLQWKWNNEDYAGLYYSYFLITLVLLSLYGINGRNGNINAVIAVVSYGISYVIYGKKKVIGAMWCWLVASVPYVLLAVYK